MSTRPPPLRFIGHATVLTELAGLRVITDPILTDRVYFLRRQRGEAHRGVGDVDVILISHHHHDHLHHRSLARLDRSATVVGPPGTEAIVSRLGFARVVEMVAGDTIELSAPPIGPASPGDRHAHDRPPPRGDRRQVLSVTAVPAVHDGRRHPWSRHDTSLGFVLATDRWTTYFAGDTALHRDMESLDPVDLALLPVWGWGFHLGHGHMGPAQAAEAVRRIEPRIAVPIHWGTLWPTGGRRIRPHLLVEPPIEFAAMVHDDDGPTRVEIALPGSSIDALGGGDRDSVSSSGSSI